MTTLNTLPHEHPLRNRPLGEIKAECRNLHSQSWRLVESWGIRKATFNQLHPVWTDNNEFRAHDPE